MEAPIETSEVERPASGPLRIAIEPQVQSFMEPPYRRAHTSIDMPDDEPIAIEPQAKALCFDHLLKTRFQRVSKGVVMAHMTRVPKESKNGQQYLNFNLEKDGEQFMRDIVTNWLGGGLPPGAMVNMSEFIKGMVAAFCQPCKKREYSAVSGF